MEAFIQNYLTLQENIKGGPLTKEEVECFSKIARDFYLTEDKPDGNRESH